MRFIVEKRGEKKHMQIAIATNDGKNVDGHFGSAGAFKIFEVSKNGYELIDEILLEVSNGEKICPPLNDASVED
ncbi:fragment of (FeMo) nitrogenase cofactor biosynthesis protein NifX (part 1/2) [Candidatus Desulfosporosinus infrequens]|uniref:Fragment of (FeMo) nitrogenase cofactor biosynthesis protein NifX (Part 1/2) n=1 Tax=Candidatus Desulfosporosinus infrequens TaxID=2043169 RepID=A0A2U3L2P8_9FIRM|nr:fragment of (FeMo) nitrogenase cofactor biosynthesis protein NifX (part 1/2) [Candidatus Desulfosporosinus infrequens]